MAAFAYGMLIRQQKELLAVAGEDPGKQPLANAEAEENKLVTAVAALIPTEIIALHALIVAQTTTTGDDGTTTITKPGLLKWSLLLLMLLAVTSYMIGRGLSRWKKKDYARAAIPAIAILVWAGIIGTSALTPWVLGIEPSLVVLVAGATGVLLIALSNRVNPPKAK